MTTRPHTPPARLIRAALLLSTLFLCGLLLPRAAAAAGSTLYVDGSSPSCSDAGSGTQTQPFCTIRVAATKVSPGVTVQVATGTYSQSVSISISGTASAPIEFAPAPGAVVDVSGVSGVGISLSSVSWVSVRGFTVSRTSDYGMNVSNSSHITLAGNHVSYAGHPVSGQNRAGIRLSGVTDSLVSGNTSDHNSDYGIAMVGGSTRNELRANLTFNNSRVFERATAGIRLYQSPGNVVDANVSHDNQDSGIECYPGSNNTLLYNNVTYNNGDHGIDDLTTTGQRIIGNTVYKNVTAGINVEGISTGATIADNISVDNGIKSPRTHSDIRVEHGSTAGTTMDYDLVYLTVPDTVLIWDSVSYSSLSSFHAATGQESHGIFANPLWVDPASGDFHLRPGSPAIDSANSGVSGWPATDVEGNARFDDPATPNTGAGPSTYDDRGAYEFQGGDFDAPPAAALSVTPSSGSAPLQVTADASASTDTDASPISSFAFDFGDGSSAVGPQAGPTATHTYPSAGSYTVTVTVTDTAGNSSTATAQVTVSSGPINLIGNPSFEADLTGWNTSGSDAGVTLTRVSGGHSGSWAARLTDTSTVAATYVLNDSPNWVKTTAADTYTASMWVRSDTPGQALKLRLREYAGTTLAGSATTTATLTTSWQQMTVTYTPAMPGASTLDLNAYVSKGPAGTSFDADDAMISVG